MGGQYETKVTDIRIHESGGEVHFHDDKAGLKVAVPVAVFKDKMVELDDPGTTKITLNDSTHGTVATLEKVGTDVKITIEKMSLIGKGLAALKNFAKQL